MARDMIDWDKVDDTALALLLLTLHDDVYVWKTLAWEITDRLHEKGLIHDTRDKAKSFALTETGLERARAAFATLFTRKA